MATIEKERLLEIRQRVMQVTLDVMDLNDLDAVDKSIVLGEANKFIEWIEQDDDYEKRFECFNQCLQYMSDKEGSLRNCTHEGIVEDSKEMYKFMTGN